ncbi:MAG: hypothetical protein HY717_23940 [Planctomycetes bacterium]|nr:hypothetical protein [Planctomycetota bacterium]
MVKLARKTTVCYFSWMLFAAAFLAMDALAACPNCKEAVAGNSASAAFGYNVSILFMLGLVGAMGSLITGLVVWVVRSEQDRPKP